MIRCRSHDDTLLSLPDSKPIDELRDRQIRSCLWIGLSDRTTQFIWGNQD
ncbi:hypothetical protein NIES2104_32720 [Leptolyngbya sp. NIES-2104]|nr:hypothetical protein NIES2104_32720 [Leptolyngbya sp. NIES-2104]